MPRRPSCPRIKDYEDFRAYLRDWYAFRKARDPRFSHGAFAKRAGLASRSHLKLVMDHGRRLSGETLERFVRGLRLGPVEAAGFRLLVRLGQATDPAAVAAARSALRRWKAEGSYRDVQAAALPADGDFWLALTLLSMARLGGFTLDPRRLLPRLLVPCTLGRIRSLLGFLVGQGYLERKGGAWVPAKALHVLDPGEARAARNMDALHRLAQAPSVREDGHATLSAVVPLGEREARRLHEAQIQWFHDHALGRPAAPGKRLYAVVTDLFPLTKA